MALSASFGPSIQHQMGGPGLHPEKPGLEEKIKTLRNIEGLLRKEAPGLLVILELIERKKLAELQMFSLTWQAVATLEASSPKGGKSND